MEEDTPSWAMDGTQAETPLSAPLMATLVVREAPRPGPCGHVVRLIKVLCGAGAVLAISIGCYSFWFAWHTYHSNHEVDAVMPLIALYVVLFNGALVLAELDIYLLFRKFPFLASRLGRAGTYFFIGSLALVQGVDFQRKYGSWYMLLAGAYEMAAGVLLALTYFCLSSGQAGEYNAARNFHQRHLTAV